MSKGKTAAPRGRKPKAQGVPAPPNAPEPVAIDPAALVNKLNLARGLFFQLAELRAIDRVRLKELTLDEAPVYAANEKAAFDAAMTE